MSVEKERRYVLTGQFDFLFPHAGGETFYCN